LKQRVIIVISLMLMIIFGFVTGNHIKSVRQKKVMAGFAALTAKKDLTVSEVVKYLDKHIIGVSGENASNLVLGLERVQQTNLAKWQEHYADSALQEKIRGCYQSEWTREKLDSIVDEDLRGILQETINNGYKIETAEGFYFPVIDYTFYQKYQSAVGPDLAAYLELMAVESERTPAKDAALVIGWDEILKRAEGQERFIKEYESSSQVQTVRQLLRRYVTFALYGCDNTPLFSYQAKQMRPEARRVYEEYVLNAEKGDFSALIKEYLNVLAANDYRLTAEVDAYRKNALSGW